MIRKILDMLSVMIEKCLYRKKPKKIQKCLEKIEFKKINLNYKNIEKNLKKKALKMGGKVKIWEKPALGKLGESQKNKKRKGCKANWKEQKNGQFGREKLGKKLNLAPKKIFEKKKKFFQSQKC